MTLSESQVRDVSKALTGTGLESHVALKLTPINSKIQYWASGGLCVSPVQGHCAGLTCLCCFIAALWLSWNSSKFHFHFALGPTNDVAGPAKHISSSQRGTSKHVVSMGSCANRSRLQSSRVQGFGLAGMRHGRQSMKGDYSTDGRELVQQQQHRVPCMGRWQWWHQKELLKYTYQVLLTLEHYLL